ncbi:MAG: DUF3592 domain-containing protein [Chloroflexota bacterium]
MPRLTWLNRIHTIEFINCPWCGQRNLENQLECRKCGGPLPPPVGDDPGPAPPLPPRTLPKGYKSRMMLKNTPLNIIGGIFALVGLPIACIFPLVGFASGLWMLLIIGGGVGALFTFLGGGMLYMGIKNGFSKIHPYEHGKATVGEVTEIYRDTSVEVNGRNPWAVLYQFEAGGIANEGKVTTWKYAPKIQAVGNCVYILYIPDDPDQSVIYPPVG